MDVVEDAPDNKSIVCVRKDNLYLKKSPLNGQGVFSSIEIQKGELVECCPLILFSKNDIEFLQYTNLYNYHSVKACQHAPGFLPLGFGAFYNHSSPSNAEYTLNPDQKTITITAICTIEPDVEITINYNGKFDNNTPVVFAKKDDVYEFSVNLL